MLLMSRQYRVLIFSISAYYIDSFIYLSNRALNLPNQHHLKADILLVIVTLLAGAGWIFSKETLLGSKPKVFNL